MKNHLEKKFMKIALDAVIKAEEVNCDPRDFVEGLKMIKEEISSRLALCDEEYTSNES